MTTLDVLRAARDLISDPARWTQRTWARGPHGMACEPNSMAAVRWCAAGAVNKVTPLLSQGDPRGDALIELDYTVADLRGIPISSAALIFDYNDTATHAEVLALFDRAIARLEREAQP